MLFGFVLGLKRAALTRKDWIFELGLQAVDGLCALRFWKEILDLEIGKYGEAMEGLVR